MSTDTQQPTYGARDGVVRSLGHVKTVDWTVKGVMMTRWWLLCLLTGWGLGRKDRSRRKVGRLGVKRGSRGLHHVGES